MRLITALLRLWHCGLKPKHLPRVSMSAELAPSPYCATGWPLLTRLPCLACDQTALEWVGTRLRLSAWVLDAVACAFETRRLSSSSSSSSPLVHIELGGRPFVIDDMG
jgi:hypothetical protein